MSIPPAPAQPDPRDPHPGLDDAATVPARQTGTDAVPTRPERIGSPADALAETVRSGALSSNGPQASTGAQIGIDRFASTVTPAADLAETRPADEQETRPAGPRPTNAAPLTTPLAAALAETVKVQPQPGIDRFAATVTPAADLAATKPADLGVTRPANLDATKPADLGATRPADLGATQAADPAADPAATVPQDAPQRPGTGALTRPAGLGSSDARATVSADQGTDRFSGTFSRTGTRLSRTRVNQRLPPQDQHLDQQLQLSRTSVLSDMTALQGEKVPAGLRKLAVDQGTDARYAIEKSLAQGGMGAVLLIEDNDFRRGAAMKVMLPKFAGDAASLERFLAEAQVTAQLEHPNIVPIHDLGVMADGTLYFTMKLIEGRSLGEVVKLRRIHRGLLEQDDWLAQQRAKDGKKPEHERRSAAQLAAAWDSERSEGAELDRRFTIEEIILTFLKVLDGVGFAHARGVVHRDIKPDNLMLGAHGEVLVVDWGIAKVLQKSDQQSELVQQIQRSVVSIRDRDAFSATMDGSAMGTPFYMPPEQAAGDLARIDGRSDIYALGATLYELLSLRRSITAQSMSELLAIIASGTWTPLNEAMPSADADLVAVVHRAMALDPQDRYATCEAFAEDLRRYLSGQAVLARRRNLIERAGRWVAAHKVQVQAGAAAVVLAGIAAGGTTWYLRSQNAQAFAAKLAEAQRLYDTGSKQHDLAILGAAQLAVAGAIERNPEDPRTGALKANISNAIANETARQEAETRQLANQAKARDLEAEADRLEREGSFDPALEKVTAALQILPGDTALMDRRENLRKVLTEREAARKQSEALALTTELAARLDRIAQSDLGGDAAERDLAVVKTAIDRFDGKDLPAVPGSAELAARQATLARQAEDERTRRRRLAEAQPFKQQTAAATTAGDFVAARAAFNQAKVLAPEDQDLGVLLERLIQGEAKAAEAARVAQVAKERDNRLRLARQKADGYLGKARDEKTRITEAKTQFLAAQATADQQRVSLAGESLAKQTPYFAALRQAAEARAAIAEHWSLGEAQANQALAALAEFPDDPLVAQGKALLCDFYVSRLRDAKKARSGPEIRAFTNLLARADQGIGAYARELQDLGSLTLRGAPADLTWRPVEEGPDTRLIPQGEAKPRSALVPLSDAAAATADGPFELAAGSYELAAGKTRLVVSVSADHPTVVSWPPALPTIPGQPLAYVPAADGGRGFALATTEVTVGAWLAFINEPAQIAEVNAAIDNAGEGLPKLPEFIYTQKGQPVLFKATPDADGRHIASWRLGEPAERPIRGITRTAAEAYCTWLAQRTGLAIRLPKAREWQLAAHGGDDRRIWPWGGVFVPGFTVGAGTARDGLPRAVGTTPTDVGPYGHLDLAGNVREWLGDGPAEGLTATGTLDALIAGGAFGDAEERTFQSTASERVEHLAANPAIGFRLLVELPATAP